MTSVCLERDGGRYTVICKGHATGSPEVCAAVSCLMYTAAGWARNAGTMVRERLRPGDARLVIAGEGCETVLDFMTVGFLQLEAQYPEFLSVEVREIR